MKRIAISGFGRIGRALLRIIFETDNLEVVGTPIGHCYAQITHLPKIGQLI